MKQYAGRQGSIPIRLFLENLGRRTIDAIEELGYIFSLFVESIYWIIQGKKQSQPVSVPTIFREIAMTGVYAVPIVSLLCFSVGMMSAIQGIETLKVFGAESQVIVGIALAITREFSPLIVGIIVAGRSGSAITARLGTMQESQEIDALRVIGISPVRYLAAPLLIAMLVAVPALTILGDLMGLVGGGIYTSITLDMSMNVYMNRCLDILAVDDVRQGLIKSIVFATIIVLVGLSNGFQVRGGAEGVGKATTRSVVMSISCIVFADMIFTYFLNR
ncbi:MAG: ABC transporter permease [Gammaproteobacteria bacterium]|nr:ABC transporter permease [Gammaproteobacteria bacterium]